MCDLCLTECGRKRSACAMDIIWSELKSNNRFILKRVLKKKYSSVR